MSVIFKNRTEAAQQLAERLGDYEGTDAVVLAIPRGGVPIGEIIAHKLHLPLDIALSKKISHPNHPEYAIGAVSLTGSMVNPGNNDVPKEYIRQEIQHLQESLKERYALFKGNAKPIDLKDKTVILTDDGVATGSTILATIDMLRQQGVKEIVVAVPVAAHEAAIKLKTEADRAFILAVPQYFMGVGQFYHDFSQVDDKDVIRLLKHSA